MRHKFSIIYEKSEHNNTFVRPNTEKKATFKPDVEIQIDPS